jgi:DNA-binding NtrC family response regulator
MHQHADAGILLPADLTGAAAAVRRAADVASRAADADEAVLIVAEPGFAPEGIARAIHQAGSRASRPFVAVDCSERVESLAARLFGNDKAVRAEYETVTGDSALALARAGTVFLGSVGEMPASVQVRLSRVLRDGELRIRKLTAPIRFRLIAAADPGLEIDVRAHRFRPELYRRLQRLRLDVPPLRDRAADLPLLLDTVFEQISRSRKVPCQLAPAARTALAALRWTGNLQELRDVLARLVDRCHDGLIRQEDVLADLQELHARPRPQPAVATLRDARQTFEREYISTVLEEYGWRMTEAARALGIERANLYRKTRQLGITRQKPSRAS